MRAQRAERSADRWRQPRVKRTQQASPERATHRRALVTSSDDYAALSGLLSEICFLTPGAYATGLRFFRPIGHASFSFETFSTETKSRIVVRREYPGLMPFCVDPDGSTTGYFRAQEQPILLLQVLLFPTFTSLIPASNHVRNMPVVLISEC